MTVFALVLTLSVTGQFEIRSEGQFRSYAECVEHMRFRLSSMDVRRGDKIVSCVSQQSVEGMMHQLFGSRS